MPAPTHATRCTPCAAGRFQSALGAVRCAQCSNGQSSAPGAGSCTACPPPPRGCAEIESPHPRTPAPAPPPAPPTLAPALRLPGQSVAGPAAAPSGKGGGKCAPGHFAARRKEVSATNPFQFDLKTRVVCVACPAGTFAPAPGARRRCRACPAGRVSSTPVATTCVLAAVGSAGAGGSGKAPAPASATAGGLSSSFVPMGKDTMVPRAPYLLGGGESNLQETAADCQRLCGATPTCRYGTYIHSGECWLSAHAHAPRQQPPCPSACSSFGVPRLI